MADDKDLVVQGMDEEDKDAPIEIIEEGEQFPCPSCGATMKFSPENQGLKCDYCETTLDLDSDDTTILEYPLSEAEDSADHNWGDEKLILHCNQCGGETVVDSSYKATTCVFCGSAQIVAQTENVGIKPESVVPFRITQVVAEDSFKAWLGKRLYAPKKLKESLKFDGIKGVYIPFFTYDSDTSTAYTAKRGDYYYTTRTKEVNGKMVTERVRHTRWRTVQGVHRKYFDDVLVNASRKVDNNLIGKIGGFNYRNLIPYRAEFLAGYTAERYSVSLRDGWDQGRKTVDDDIYSGIRRQVGGDEFRLINRSTNYGEVKFKHLLLPIYMSSFMYRDKVYQFLVHGETGKVVSEYPKSVVKIILTVLVIMAIIAGVYFYLQS